MVPRAACLVLVLPPGSLAPLGAYFRLLICQRGIIEQNPLSGFLCHKGTCGCTLWEGWNCAPANHSGYLAGVCVCSTGRGQPPAGGGSMHQASSSARAPSSARIRRDFSYLSFGVRPPVPESWERGAGHCLPSQSVPDRTERDTELCFTAPGEPRALRVLLSHGGGGGAARGLGPGLGVEESPPLG